MATLHIDLPGGWTERTDEPVHDSALIECQYTTDHEVTFIASVVPRADDKAYCLHLSTVNPTSVPVRHNYPVTDYGTWKAAIDGVESFTEHVSLQLEKGSLSSVHPENGEIRETIQGFSDGRRFSPIQNLVRCFQ